MLRNRGVNVTEQRIRHDVLRAYEYDIFDASPRYRLHEACQTNYHRQPRYCTARWARPTHFHTASSITSYGVKRVYLPDEEWGAGSAESTVYVRNPRYNMRSYYPNEAYHLSGERPYRSDVRYEGYYSRRPSSMYVDDDDYHPNWQSRHTDRRLVRKVTRKLSPIFTCDCARTSNVKHQKKNSKNNNTKIHNNDLSKEARELSLDIFKIISLLQKADGEDEEEFSSVSLLQNVHNLDCRSSKSIANVITQRVNVCQKMQRHKQEDTLTKCKIASGVRSKLEALVDALKQYEAEKYFDRADSSNYEPKYRNVIPSDPPSLEVRSFSNGKDLKSSTNIDVGKQKDIVLQTEEPKMSNKGVYGKVKVKTGDSSAERKSLRSRLSWRKKESSGIKMRRDSGNERLIDKKTARKRSFFCKTKSKTRIRSILESEHSQSEKNVVSKQGQATKAGLMIKIGGNPQRKKSATPEKLKEKPPKPWIKKFLEDKNNTKNNIRVRWNNKAFYAKSSSTIFEIVSNVYKQMGINYSKSDEISTSKQKKTPKRSTRKHSKTRMQNTSMKPKYKHKVEAYMMPQIIVPGPLYTPNITNQDTEKFIGNPHGITSNVYSGINTTSSLSINYFEIKLPNNFFDPASTSEGSTSDKHEYKVVEYKAINPDAFEDTTTTLDYYDGINDDQECALNGSRVDDSKDLHSEHLDQNSNSLCFPKIEHGEMNIIMKEPESEPTISRSEMPKLLAEETEPHIFIKSGCSLAKNMLHDEYFNWMPETESLVWSGNYDDLDKISIIHDDVSIKTDIDITTESSNEVDTQNNISNTASIYSKDVNKGKMFSTWNNSFVQWKNRASGTLSESIVGINSRKPIVVSVFWNLIKLLKKGHSSKSKTRLPPQDISLVQPPGIVSQPECSCTSQNHYITRKPLRSQKQKLLFEPLRLAQLATAALQVKKDLLVIPSLIRKSLHSMQFNGLAEDAFEVEKPEDVSLSRSRTESTEASDRALLLNQPSPINVELFQGAVSAESKIEQKTSATPRKPLCQVRLVRSVHTNTQIERDIKPKAARSALLLRHQMYQNSQLLLFVLPIFCGVARIGERLNKYKQSEEKLPQNLPQCLPVPSNYEQQGLEVESVDNNEAFKETANNSQHIIKNENSGNTFVHKLTPDKTDPVKLCLKQANSDIKEQKNIGSSQCDFRNTSDSKPNKNEQLACLIQQPETGNNTFPSDIPCILDKNAATQFSVEVRKGDTVTKIFIRNRKSNNRNNLILTNLGIFEHPAANDFKTTKKSNNKLSDKKVKLYINIRKTNPSEVENGENPRNKSDPNHIFDNQLPKKEVDEFQVFAKRNTNINNSNDDAEGSQCCHIYKTYSLQPFTDSSVINDKSGTNDITKTPNETLCINKCNDLLAVTKKWSIDNHDTAAEDYVNKILGTKDKVDHTKLKRVVDMRRTLNAMTMLNVNAYAEMALMRELASDHNDTYMSLRQQLKRRKKIVSILSEINMRNIRTDYIKQQAKTGDIFDDSGSNENCSLCNLLARKLNSHRCVEIDMPTNFDVKGDIAANYYFPDSASPVMPLSFELEELLSSYKEEHIFGNTDTLLSKDNVGVGAMLMESLLHSPKRKYQEKIHEAKPICWCCVKNMNKKSKKNQTKKWQSKKRTKRVPNSCQNDGIILVNTDSYNSQNSSFTEYMVRFKTDDSIMTDDSAEKLYNGGNKSDILQSCKLKKAVLQIYSDETVEDDGYIVAKLPKYLRL